MLLQHVATVATPAAVTALSLTMPSSAPQPSTRKHTHRAHVDEAAGLELRALPLAQILAVDTDGAGGIHILQMVWFPVFVSTMRWHSALDCYSRAKVGIRAGVARAGLACRLAERTLRHKFRQLALRIRTVTNRTLGESSGLALPSASKMRCTPLRQRGVGYGTRAGRDALFDTTTGAGIG